MFKGRIVLKFNDELRHLASYSIGPDGSLYYFWVREGENEHALESSAENTSMTEVKFDKPRKKTKKISYHTTGLVLYHDMTKNKVYREPLYSLTTPNLFTAYVIPTIEKLDKLDESNEQDFVYELTSDEVRQFSVSVAPWQCVPNTNGFAIRFHQLFALTIEVSDPKIAITEELAQHVINLTPSSPISSCVIDEPTAFAQFHQSLNNTKGLIIYSPNVNGEYKIICAVPMRIAPRLHIDFKDSDYKYEQLPAHAKRGTAEVKFKVRNKSGYVKTEVEIDNLILDAELY